MKELECDHDWPKHSAIETKINGGAESDEAYQLDTIEKLPRSEIGSLKGWSKSKVTSLLKRAYERRGKPTLTVGLAGS